MSLKTHTHRNKEIKAYTEYLDQFSLKICLRSTPSDALFLSSNLISNAAVHLVLMLFIIAFKF